MALCWMNTLAASVYFSVATDNGPGSGAVTAVDQGLCVGREFASETETAVSRVTACTRSKQCIKESTKITCYEWKTLP